MPLTEPHQQEEQEEPQETGTESREFKYYPGDFGRLPVKVEHFHLVFDVFDDYTVIESDMTIVVLEPKLKKLSLDAKNLEVVDVALYDAVKGKEDDNKKIPRKNISFHYDDENYKLHIELSQPKMKGDIFTIYTKTITRPTKNVLEGLYYDETPKGAPPTQITQCQQWGFQRLVPCFDDMTAKCTYTTTIIADARYTNMISNGDVVTEFHDKHGNVQKRILENGRALLRYEMHKTPMAPYLFFLGVGTYLTVKKEFEYPDGKKFMLELLVPPDADKIQAAHALDILSYGILWIHLRTGAGKYDALDVKKKIEELIKTRDSLKQKEKTHEKELQEIRKELAHLVKPLTLGYQYTGDVYREIGMQNSNFGGMENVGNTTIVTNRIMPFAQITDESFEYMMEVKAHEFYHNLNGSEVTGLDPFVLWLNEAVTCHIETEYLAHIMGDAYTRISRVMTLHAPMFGTFAEDNGPAAMPIIPKAFNTPDELITGMTYVKAPEFVKMIEILMGKEKFVKALALYHQRFQHKNASTADWLAAMEEVSGFHFKTMAIGWLTRTGFPRVFVNTLYNKEKREYQLTLTQKGFDEYGPWQFPFVYALLDKHGKEVLTPQLHWIKHAEEVITHPVEEPAYVSFNRNHALYGIVVWEQQTQQQLELQAQTDSDVVTRYMAFSTLLDQEKVKLVKKQDAEISPVLVSLYGKILTNTNLTSEVKALFLAITDSVRNESVNHKYKEIYAAKEKIKRTIATTYKKELLELYKKYSSEKFHGTYIEQQLLGMKNRDMKSLVLSLLASLDTKDVLNMVKQQLQTATHASDKNVAMALYLNSTAQDKLILLEEFKKEAEQHLVSWESFLRIVGSNNSDDAIAIIKKIEQDNHFRIEQSNDQRGLYLSFAANRKKSVLTSDGLMYLTELIIKVSKLNEYTGFHFLAAFSDLEKMEIHDQIAMVGALSSIKEALNKKEHPSVHNNIQRILKGCPKAVKAWKQSQLS